MMNKIWNWIKKLICRIFNIKSCQCEKQDPHLEIYEETAKQKKIRLKYKGDVK